MNTPIDQKRNLKYFYWTGAAFSVYESLTLVFIIPFAVALGASNLEIGILGALTYLAALISELPGAKLMDFLTRKNLFIWTLIAARAGWIFIAFAPFVLKEHLLLWIMALYSYIRIVDLLHDPAWMSLIADIVPAQQLGSVTAKRRTIIGIGGLISSVIAGFYLDFFPKDDYFGFSSLFAIGFVFAFLEFYAASEINEPPNGEHTHHLREAYHLPKNLAIYTGLSMLFDFAIMLASPFFTVYMLKNLDMSYTWFVLTGGLMAITKILIQQHVGRLTDTAGDIPVMVVSGIGTALIPLAFIFITPATWWLVLPVHILIGIVWAGVDITRPNLVINYTEPAARATQTASYNMATALTTTAGSIIGGIIADNYTFLGLAGIPLVFAIAFALRLITGFLFILLPEVRVTKEYSLGFVAKQILLPITVHGVNERLKTIVKKINHSSAQPISRTMKK